MSFQDAVRAAQGGVLIDSSLSRGERDAGASGYNEWRRRIEAKLKAPPERGRANESCSRRSPACSACRIPHRDRLRGPG